MAETTTCMIDSIGLTAGDIWGYLADNGEVTLSKMKKVTIIGL